MNQLKEGLEEAVGETEPSTTETVDEELLEAIRTGTVNELIARREAAAREADPGLLRAEWAEETEEPAIKRMREERDAKPETERVPRDRAENAEFWDRDDIRGGRHALDVWASCKWARISGVGTAVPTMEAIFEFPRPQDWQPGASIADLEWSAVRTSLDHPEAYPRMVELAVDGVLLKAGATAMALILLLELYPRTGTYQRPAFAPDREPPLADPEGAVVRAYRPECVVALTGGIRTPAMQKRVDSILNQLHRELVLTVARSVALPPEVFAAEIVGIRVPEKPKGRPKKSRPANETAK